VEQGFIDALVNAPSESLSVELKGWLNPDLPHDAARIVKACIALRNNGGGFLILGFTNNGQPDVANMPPAVERQYHIDRLQQLVSRHAGDNFEIFVRWAHRQDAQFPIIEVPSGVKNPIAIRSPLSDASGDVLLPENRVYVRSLQSNNRPSTTEATWRDWPRIVEICFENREADIARFIRRHLATASEDTLRDALAFLNISAAGRKTAEERAEEFLQFGRQRFNAVVTERQVTLPDHGSWHVAAVIDGELPQHRANKDFLNLLMSSNPKYTGWPVWVDSRSLGDANPYVHAKGWESFIFASGGMFVEIDFWRLEPIARFYHRRAYQDDVDAGGRVKPFEALDIPLIIYRTAEAIAVALEFARAMGAPPESSTMALTFMWDRLRGRQAASWEDRARFITPGYSSRVDEVDSSIVVPLDTSRTALGPIVHTLTTPLFEAFGGLEIDPRVVEELTRKVIERRW